MYELKRLLKRHIEENLLKYILALCIFVAGVILGFLFSRRASLGEIESINREIDGLISGFSGGNFSRVGIIKTSFLKILRISLLFFLGGISLWLLPISFGVFLSYGFSLGFTAGYLALNFGGKGVGIALCSLLPVFLIAVPVYIIMSVVAINKGRGRKKSGDDFGLYLVIFAFLFVISLTTLVADGFLIPTLMGLICG